MRRFIVAATFALGSLSSLAQADAAVIYKTDGSQAAVSVTNIDSIKVMSDVVIVHDTIWVERSESKWKGAKIGFLGDSITDNGEYVNWYAKLTGCEAKNYGIGATHMARRNSGDTNAFDARYNKILATCKMVVVFGGTNDFGHSDTAEFGEFTDGAVEGKYTFYAGLHRLFKGLKTRFKNKPVVVMTPVHHGVKIDTPEYKINSDGSLEIGRNAKTGRPFIDYVNAIKEVAAYYSLPVLDAYSYSDLCPMTEINSANDFSDGLHLNDHGGEKLAKWMYPQLETIYDMYYKK